MLLARRNGWSRLEEKATILLMMISHPGSLLLDCSNG